MNKRHVDRYIQPINRQLASEDIIDQTLRRMKNRRKQQCQSCDDKEVYYRYDGDAVQQEGARSHSRSRLGKEASNITEDKGTKEATGK